MPRGGLRPNTKVESNHLFKPKWNNKTTTAIRIPAIFKDALLGIARHLDKTQFSTEKDISILDDIVNCFKYKKLAFKYESELINLRKENNHLIQRLNDKTNQKQQKKNQNEYKAAVECFDEFLSSKNLNMEELSKSRKGTKKYQLFEINQWLLEQSNNNN